MSQNDRREHERISKTLRVEFCRLLFPLDEQEVFGVTSLDVSAGGILLTTGSEFQAGEKIKVRLYIASLNKFHSSYLKIFESDVGQYLQAIAEVVRVERVDSGFRLGIKFLDVHEDDWQALKKLLERELSARAA